MKVFLILAVLVGSIVLWNIAKPDSSPKLSKTTISPTVVLPSIIPQKTQKQYLFVPYWSFGKTIDNNGFDSLIYFGVGVNNNGIELKDKGYENLSAFVTKTQNAKERILAVRMVDKNINADILKNLKTQESIASAAVSLATKNNFTGVLLDYETSALAFDSTTKNITSFYKLLSQKAHDNNLQFYVSLYGDTYFRARPFDIKQIGLISDKVLIMAYDFSKSSGNPGPDFPLADNGTYGYSFSKMVDDFQKDVVNEKIVIILGYFGYDWRVDNKEIALAAGIPLTTGEITKEFITKCSFKKCSLNRVQNTDEPSIRYIDESGENHIVWFEDDVSIAKKKEFSKSKGILETAAWAYSYY